VEGKTDEPPKLLFLSGRQKSDVQNKTSTYKIREGNSGTGCYGTMSSKREKKEAQSKKGGKMIRIDYKEIVPS